MLPTCCRSPPRRPARPAARTRRWGAAAGPGTCTQSTVDSDNHLLEHLPAPHPPPRHELARAAEHLHTASAVAHNHDLHRCVDIQIVVYLDIICHLDTLRVGVRHQNVPLLGDGHALRVGELAPAPPPGGNTLYLHI